MFDVIDVALREVLVSILIQVSLLTVLVHRRLHYRATSLCYIGGPWVASYICMKDLAVTPVKLYARPGTGPMQLYVVC